jgi:hypothetical protein
MGPPGPDSLLARAVSQNHDCTLRQHSAADSLLKVPSQRTAVILADPAACSSRYADRDRPDLRRSAYGPASGPGENTFTDRARGTDPVLEACCVTVPQSRAGALTLAPSPFLLPQPRRMKTMKPWPFFIIATFALGMAAGWNFGRLPGGGGGAAVSPAALSDRSPDRSPDRSVARVVPGSRITVEGFCAVDMSDGSPARIFDAVYARGFRPIPEWEKVKPFDVRRNQTGDVIITEEMVAHYYKWDEIGTRFSLSGGGSEPSEFAVAWCSLNPAPNPRSRPRTPRQRRSRARVPRPCHQRLQYPLDARRPVRRHQLADAVVAR